MQRWELRVSASWSGTLRESLYKVNLLYSAHEQETLHHHSRSEVRIKGGWECYQDRIAADKPWETLICERTVHHDHGWYCVEDRDDLDTEPYTRYCRKSIIYEDGGVCVWVKREIDEPASLADGSDPICKSLNSY